MVQGMIGLPASLAPWRAELEIFPRDLALSLGSWVARLAAVVGRFGDPRGADGEPDGYDGIARAGTYERLLHSEWLLADELPDEFLRRAAAGEHGFFALARAQPAGSRRCVAVFDAGPDQLGSPRLAHLALLVLLSRRARMAGAELIWGCAHRPGHPRGEVTAASVLHLMRARTPSPPRAEDLRTWAARAGGDGDDLWFIGGESLARAADGLGGSRVRVDDVLSVERRAVSVTALRSGARAVTVELELPPRPQAVRLLRDPFQAARPSPVHAAANPIASTVRFNMRGDRILARCSDGSVVGWHVPRSTRDPPGHPRVARAAPGEAIVAVEILNARRMVAVSLRDSSLLVRPGGAPPAVFDVAADPPAPPERQELWSVSVLEEPGCTRYAVGTHTGGLLVLGPSAGAPAAAFSSVLAVGPRNTRRAPLPVWRLLRDEVLGCILTDGYLTCLWREPAREPRVVSSVPPGVRPHPYFGMTAVRVELDRWIVVGQGWIASPPDEGQVVGVVDDGDPDVSRQREAALVVVAPDRTGVFLRTARASRAVLEGKETIAHACSSTDGSLIAVAYDDGRIRVVSRRDGSEHLLVNPERP